MRYEYPQGRRVNALAAYRPYDRAPRLEVATAERAWVAEDLVVFLNSSPREKCPRVVMLDNAGLQTKAARLARRELMALGILLDFPPAYGPELNDMRSSRSSGR